MRFRKSIKICKGVRLNLSKSGISTSIGGHGISVTTGKKGTYLNTGIPGTGLYDRRKISSSNKKSNQNNMPKQKLKSTQRVINLKYNEDGTMKFFLENGEEIVDAKIIRNIKQTDVFKSELDRLNKERLDEYNSKNDEIVDISKHSKKVLNTIDYENQLKNLKPKKYCKKKYNVLEPSKQKIRDQLHFQAFKEINTLKFWKKGSLIDEYIETHFNDVYQQEYDKWLMDKNAYELKENENEILENQKFLDIYNEERQSLEKSLSNDIEFVSNNIQKWFDNVVFPFDCSIQYNIENNKLFIDLDLPEIENMVKVKVQKMANGTVKIKNKTQKELKEDYIQCVFGLALFISSYLFEIAIGIPEIVVSGYTQRRNNKGDLCDDYIYSIRFLRTEFVLLDFGNSAEENCMKFENRCNLLANHNFKTIIPFDE